MSGKRSRSPEPVKNKDGIIITEEQKQRARWVEHFWDILNRPPPTEMPNITATGERLLNVTVNPPPKGEIERAVKEWESSRSRWYPPWSSQSRPKNYNSYVTPAFSSDLGDREGSNWMKEWLSCQAAQNRGSGALQELERNHAPLSPQQGFLPNYSWEAETCPRPQIALWTGRV